MSTTDETFQGQPSCLSNLNLVIFATFDIITSLSFLTFFLTVEFHAAKIHCDINLSVYILI